MFMTVRFFGDIAHDETCQPIGLTELETGEPHMPLTST